jgi:hypothetical protein
MPAKAVIKPSFRVVVPVAADHSAAAGGERRSLGPSAQLGEPAHSEGIFTGWHLDLNPDKTGSLSMALDPARHAAFDWVNGHEYSNAGFRKP